MCKMFVQLGFIRTITNDRRGSNCINIPQLIFDF